MKNMKIYLSADIEGVCGVTHWDETDSEKHDWQDYREQMTAEVVAACDGAIQAGATELWVKDAHDTARNLYPAKLPQMARLLRGWRGHPLVMLDGMDKTFQAVVFIGFHSGAGSSANPLSHTLTGRFFSVKFNDRYVSEFLMYTYAAAYLKVPVVFVSGDQGLCNEATELNPNITTVAVKEGIGDSTINIHPELAIARIKEGVSKALTGNIESCQIVLPSHFSVETRYIKHTQAYKTSFYPNAQLLDPYTVLFESDDYFDVLRFMLFAE